MCLAQEHNEVTQVRLEPTAPRSRVRHYTIEPLRFLNILSLTPPMLTSNTFCKQNDLKDSMHM